LLFLFDQILVHHHSSQLRRKQLARQKITRKTMEGVVVQNGEQVLPGPSWANNQFSRYENNQGNWMEQMRGSLMVVATVIASLTFQIAINPPGGVWQSNTNTQDGCAPDQTCKAGTSVIAIKRSDMNCFYCYVPYLSLLLKQ
jgi:hypothetical protein